MRRQRRAGDTYKAALQRVFTFIKKAAPTSLQETEAVFAWRVDFFKRLLLQTGLSNSPVKWIQVAGTKGKGSRSAESRGGRVWVRTGRSRWCREQYIKNKIRKY